MIAIEIRTTKELIIDGQDSELIITFYDLLLNRYHQTLFIQVSYDEDKDRLNIGLSDMSGPDWPEK